MQRGLGMPCVAEAKLIGNIKNKEMIQNFYVEPNLEEIIIAQSLLMTLGIEHSQRYICLCLK